jgi:acyl carrier protein
MTHANRDSATVIRTVLCDELRAHHGAPAAMLERLDDDVALGNGGLALSSLLLLSIFVKLEAALGFTFEDAAVAGARFLTVGDLVRFVSTAAQGHGGAR